MAGPVRDPAQAFQQLEAIMLRQMLQSSGAFRAGNTPGAQLRTDMFVETLADAVAKAGGLGIAKMLQHQLGGTAKDDPASPLTTSAGAALRRPAGGAALDHGPRGGGGPGGAAPAAVGAYGIDDLDDPNSEAPLPEDPGADSIDDYQAGAAHDHRGAGGALPVSAASSSSGEISGEITSGFGQRVHPITGDVRFHTGIDLRAPEGAPIRAAAGGVIVDAGRRGGYGNAVEIDHGNGTTTLYAHASAVLVGKGERVEPGQTVALVGQTGQATGPHLHFEVRRHDHPVNPSSGRAPISIARALNTYRERAEATDAGTPSRARDGENP